MPTTTTQTPATTTTAVPTTTTAVPTTTTQTPATTMAPVKIVKAATQCISDSPVEIIQCTKQIAESAFTTTREHLENSNQDDLDFNFLVAPNAPISHVTNVKNALTPGVTFWSFQLPSDQASTLFILTGEDLDWFFEEMTALGLNGSFEAETEEKLRDGTRGLGVAYNRPALDGSKVVAFINFSVFESFITPGLASRNAAIQVAAHEWTHLVQGVLSENVFNSPCWWTEGSAEFFSTIPSLREQVQNYDDYLTVRIGHVKANLDDRSVARTRQITDWVDWLKISECSKSSYGAGYLAAEYLVGQYGFTAAVEIMKLIGPEMSWEAAIEQVYGTPYFDLLTEIAKHLKYVFSSTEYLSN